LHGDNKQYTPVSTKEGRSNEGIRP